jgi:hypothetical protein
MQKSNEIDQLFKALSSAQAEMEDPVKGSRNPHFGSNYADLASVLKASRKVLATHGLCVIQLPTYDANTKAVIISTTVGHVSGQWISEDLPIPVSKPDAQGVGSAITYGRRYAYMAAIGIAPDDDDGNAAANRGDKAQESRREFRRDPEPPANPGPVVSMPRQAAGEPEAMPRRVADLISTVKAAPAEDRAKAVSQAVALMYADLAEVTDDESAAARVNALLASVRVKDPAEISRPSELRTVLMGIYGHIQAAAKERTK